MTTDLPPLSDQFEIRSLSVGPLVDFSTTIKLRSITQISGESGSGKTFLCKSIETENFLRFPISSSKVRTELRQPPGTFRSLPIVLTSSLFNSFSASSSIFDILQLASSVEKLINQGSETDSTQAEAVLATLKELCGGKLVALGVAVDSLCLNDAEVAAQAALLQTERVLYEGKLLLVSDLSFPLRSGRRLILILDRLRIEDHHDTRILTVTESIQQAGYSELKVYNIQRSSGSSSYHEVATIPCKIQQSCYLSLPESLRNSNSSRNSEDLFEICGNSGFSDQVLQGRVFTYTLGELLTSPLGSLQLDQTSHSSPYGSFLLFKLSLLNALGLGELPLATGWGALTRSEQLRVAVAATIQPSLKNVLYLLDEPFELLAEKERNSVFSVLTERVKEDCCTVLLALNEHIIDSNHEVLRLPQPRRQRKLKRCNLDHQDQVTRDQVPIITVVQQQVCLEPGHTYAFQHTKVGSSHLLLSDIILPQLENSRFNHQLDLHESRTSTTLPIYHDLRPLTRFRPTTTVATYLKMIVPLAEVFADLPLSRERGITASNFVRQNYLALCLPGQPPLFKGFRYEELLATSFHDLSFLLMFHPALRQVISWLQRGGVSYLQPDSRLISLGLGEQTLLRLCKLGIRAQPNSIVLIESPQLGLDVTQVHAAKNLISCMEQNGVTLLYSQSGSLPDLGAVKVIMT